jgi:glycosyltransferase involved in cell wall biosynthesis
MKIAYCTNVRLPSERAHGHQVAAVCDALAALQHEVTIFAPYRKNPVQESFQDYYGLKHTMALKHLGKTDYIAAWWTPGVLGLTLLTHFFSSELRTYLKSHRFDLIYTRTPEILSAFHGLSVPVILELHKIPRTMHFSKVANRCALIVALTNPMKHALMEMGVTAPIVVEGDAVDLAQFASVKSANVRESYDIPKKDAVIVYTGQLQSMGLSKGIPEFLSALEILEDQDLDFHAVIAGGPQHIADTFAKTLPQEVRAHITFTGHMDHAEIPALMAAADVLVYPAPKSNHTFYQRDTSPLKLFEYMAAGRPIVAADLPPLHDVVDSSTVTFVEPGSGKALAEGINWVLKNPEKAQEKAKKAHSKVQEYTWEKRMKRILEAATIAA